MSVLVLIGLAAGVSPSLRVPGLMRWRVPHPPAPGRPKVYLHLHGLCAEDMEAILARVNREGGERVD